MKHSGGIYLLAALTGAIAGLWGAVFHFLLDRLDAGRLLLRESLQGAELPGWAVMMALGAVMVGTALWLVRRFAPDAGGSGIQEIEGVLGGGARRLDWKRLLPVKFVAGGLAIGSGMILGREGPTIHMGGALGAMVGAWARLNEAGARTLIAAGAGAGLTAAFNAPLAGIVFVIEEMREAFEFNFVTFNAVVLTCCVAEVVNGAWLGQGPLLPLIDFPAPSLSDLTLFAVLGIAVGIFGVFFEQVLIGALDWFEGFGDINPFVVGAAVGAVTGALAWFLPALTGGGERLVEDLIGSQFALGSLGFLILARTLTTVLSYGSGVPGGIFAPMLALGTLAGLIFGSGVEQLFPGNGVAPGSFVVAAMGALFAATVQAPLTGIILVIELTNNHQMILAIIVTCLTASLTAAALGGRPVYRVLLERCRARR
ncbi:MAG: H(+)/Cl(-) exchange transporter ClcA [Gammaproteobacteria bacterium]|jgi:H+/Cl- antiporter ClcA|nr:H(+)/Cl(-) exchange transporter ClcA [Gammaproteobacteria bacterium]